MYRLVAVHFRYPVSASKQAMSTGSSVMQIRLPKRTGDALDHVLVFAFQRTAVLDWPMMGGSAPSATPVPPVLHPWMFDADAEGAQIMTPRITVAASLKGTCTAESHVGHAHVRGERGAGGTSKVERRGRHPSAAPLHFSGARLGSLGIGGFGRIVGLAIMV